MADILIRMEMPKTCCQCDLKIYDPEKRWDENGIERIGAWVCKRTREIIWNTKRGDNCPLVPLPEGHGRLGDLTEIEKKLQKTLDAMGDRWLSSPSMMAQRVAIVADLKKVKEAPTVIPEEGGMDDG